MSTRRHLAIHEPFLGQEPVSALPLQPPRGLVMLIPSPAGAARGARSTAAPAPAALSAALPAALALPLSASTSVLAAAGRLSTSHSIARRRDLRCGRRQLCDSRGLGGGYPAAGSGRGGSGRGALEASVKVSLPAGLGAVRGEMPCAAQARKH